MRITERQLRNKIRRAIRECGMEDTMPYPDDSMVIDYGHAEGHGPSKTGVFDAPDEEHPGYMLLGNLKKLAVKSAELADLASPWDDAEPWIESKINSAAQHIDAIHDYIMYSVLDQEFDAEGHEDMMYECGEMMGDMMTEPMSRNMGDGGSAAMVRGQLFQIAKKSQSMSDRLTDTDTLPEWLQSKVAMAYQSIATISDYLDYKITRYDAGEPVHEGLMDTVKGAFTGGNKLADKVMEMIKSDQAILDDMYNSFSVQRGTTKPEAAIRSNMVNQRSKFSDLYDAAGVTSDQVAEVEKLLLPKLVDHMKKIDKDRVSAQYGIGDYAMA